ncbi:MAG: PilN domain-containing protein [Polyangiaceae bacterium]|nr:PilN domain-containing protein [Polyangiaceae bacterium]MCW5789293.1 PilN domain-containing protein [Polyangiaceae bacterium]
MIRINLLPQKRAAATQEGGQLWLVAAVLLIAIQGVALFTFHSFKQQQLDAKELRNRELQKQIDESVSRVRTHQEVKDQLATLRAREDAIAKLQSARSGPTGILLELARILTPGRGPSVDPDTLNQLRRSNPLAVYNPSWDARRLWLARFVEEQRSVRLEGVARDGEDVSELAKRLNLSSYYHDVKLLPAKKELDSSTRLEVVRFQLEAKVKY